MVDIPDPGLQLDSTGRDLALATVEGEIMPLEPDGIKLKGRLGNNKFTWKWLEVETDKIAGVQIALVEV